MNRFTEFFDKMDFSFHGYTDIECALFSGGSNETFWKETYNTICEGNSREAYREILPLFCPLLANLTDEELEEYINSFTPPTI